VPRRHSQVMSVTDTVARNAFASGYRYGGGAIGKAGQPACNQPTGRVDEAYRRLIGLRHLKLLRPATDSTRRILSPLVHASGSVREVGHASVLPGLLWTGRPQKRVVACLSDSRCERPTPFRGADVCHHHACAHGAGGLAHGRRLHARGHGEHGGFTGAPSIRSLRSGS
jgi:hypothetical protein